MHLLISALYGVALTVVVLLSMWLFLAVCRVAIDWITETFPHAPLELPYIVMVALLMFVSFTILLYVEGKGP